MNEKSALPGVKAVDSKIQTDWEAVQKRLADLNDRSGGDMRRQAALNRLGALQKAS